MSKTLISLLGATALGALTLLPAIAAEPVENVKPGDKPEYSWRSPLVNGMGKSSLADMKGQMVLVEFWGTR